MKTSRPIQLLMSLLFLLTVMAGTSQSALKAVGPVDSVSTLPKWYQDTSNLALEPCLDQNLMCLLPPPFDPLAPPISPITTTPGSINNANFPGESFYYSAVALLNIEPALDTKNGVGELANLAFVLEAAFLGGVIPDTGITFLRTDLQKMRHLTPNSTYRVTHPYGTFLFTTDGAGDTTGGGGVAVRQEDPSGTAALWMPALMKSASTTKIGPFLTPASGILLTRVVGAETHTYIGDPAVPILVTGSPSNNNFFRIERLDAFGVPVPGAAWQTNLFALAGKVFTGPIPSDLTINATYARDANKGQVDIFASTLPGAALSISGDGITTTSLTPDTPTTGKHFLTIPLASSTLPTNVKLTNSLDLQATPPHPITLVDEVNITEANYNQVTNVLTVKASSRDKVAPFPTLSVTGFSAPNSLDANGTFTKTLTDIPPQEITVTSSNGGSATAPVSVGVPEPLVITTAETLPDYAIGSLFNQLVTASGGVSPYTWSASVVGTLPPGLNFFPSSGRLFGTPTTFGVYNFGLQVADSLGTVAIKPFTLTSSTPPNPVAVADSATTTAGSTVTINVLANDTSPVSSINPATVSVSAATGGAAVANLDGTISYTSPMIPGAYSFNYTVRDTGTTPLMSNSALVTINVTASAATLISPQGNTILLGTSQEFFWTNSGADFYQLAVGTTGPGAVDIGLYPGTPTTSNTATVTGLPTNGRTVYVRIYSKIGSIWYATDYTFTAATSSGTSPATMISPTSPLTFTGTSQAFSWTNTGANAYQLAIGTTGPGSIDIGYFPATASTATTTTVTGLPSNGSTIYVRIYSQIGGTWLASDYTYTATTAATAATAATMLAPLTTTIIGSSQSFDWTNSGADLYQLAVGTTGPGAIDIGYFPSVASTATSAIVSGLPTNGSTVYVRIYSKIGGTWFARDYQYISN
jgi:hypothetical protein